MVVATGSDGVTSRPRDAAASWARLERAWATADAFFENSITRDALLARPIQLRNPFIFYLGHLPAFAWNTVRKQLPDQPHLEQKFELDIFDRGVDPDVLDPSSCHRHSAPPARYPTVEVIREYRARVRSHMRSLENIHWHTVETIAEHEYMHIETLLYMTVDLPSELKTRPKEIDFGSAGLSATTTSHQRVDIPSGSATLGASMADKPGVYGWDNEFGKHVVHVPAFSVDTLPVTVEQFREFVDSAGYGRADLWEGTDAVWRAKNDIRFPKTWGPNGTEYRAAFFTVPLDDARKLPVYVSLAEARAYAKWKGGSRLLTEAEWHRCAYGRHDGTENKRFPWGDDDEPGSGPRGNFGSRAQHPLPVGTFKGNVSQFGVRDLVGDGWELCDTVFEPFEGFVAQHNYPEYSTDFFDDKHFVLKGASWATDESLVRPSFRNFFQAHYPHAFAKFRTVAV